MCYRNQSLHFATIDFHNTLWLRRLSFREATREMADLGQAGRLGGGAGRVFGLGGTGDR